MLLDSMSLGVDILVRTVVVVVVVVVVQLLLPPLLLVFFDTIVSRIRTQLWTLTCSLLNVFAVICVDSILLGDGCFLCCVNKLNNRRQSDEGVAAEEPRKDVWFS